MRGPGRARRRSRTLVVGVPALVAALVLGACGTSSPGAGDSSPAAATSSDTDAAPGLGAADRARVQAAVDDLLDTTPITFLPDSTIETPSGGSAVGRLGALLGPIASARAVVTGYTAPAPGGRAEAAALALQRAQAVIAALTQRGVDPARLTAVSGGTDPSQPAHGRSVTITVA